MYGRSAQIFAVLFFLAVLGGCSKKEKSTDELLGDLKGSKEREQVIAVRTLPQRKSDAAKVVPALIESLKDRGADVRWSAAIGLGTFGDKAKNAIPALQVLRNDPDARVREAAAKAIVRIDPNAAATTAASR